MPTYEYVCQDCDTKFECRRPYENADDEIDCTVCNSHKTKRALSRIFVRNETGSITKGQSNCSCCSGSSCSTCGH
jgi:putative FmdB family regulatory protein